MKSNAVASEETIAPKPKYYEVDGALKVNANRAWLLAFLTVPVALLAIGFAVFVRLQPPTVIRIGPDGQASLLGQPSKSVVATVASGTDEFLDQAFVKRFLANYLNYSPANVDDRWASSLNMMTRNLTETPAKLEGESDGECTPEVRAA